MAGQIADVDYDEILNETNEAVLLQFGPAEVWLPSSQIELDRDGKVVSMPEWLAIKEGLV